MTKKELLRLLRLVPDDTVIGFRANDLNEEYPAEHFAFGNEVGEEDFAFREQGIGFILV